MNTQTYFYCLCCTSAISEEKRYLTGLIFFFYVAFSEAVFNHFYFLRHVSIEIPTFIEMYLISIVCYLSVCLLVTSFRWWREREDSQL